MEKKRVDFSTFDNSGFDRGAARWKELCWMIVSALFFGHSLCIWNGAKIFWLRVFGAKVGRHVLIKPKVTIKFPWKLVLGDHIWIGEQVWIDNLAPVYIRSHACISQGALLLTGNHDYRKSAFDLIVKPIVVQEGAWIGAKAVVTQGVTVGSHAVLGAGSVATKNLEAYGIYRGNPATLVRTRTIS